MKTHAIDAAGNERKTRILVAGAGAIGSLMGGCLARAGADVLLLDSWREHIEAMRTGGLRLEEPDRVSTVAVKAVHTSEISGLENQKMDIILVSVKSQDTASMLALVKPLLAEDGFVVSCQNGINEDVISSVVGASATLGCICYLGATLIGPGHVKRLPHQGAHLVIGEHRGGVTERVKALAALLSVFAEGIVTDDLRGERWAKLAENSAANPLLALTGYTGLELDKNKLATPVKRAIIRELVLVAEACGEQVKPIIGIQSEAWKTPLSVAVPEINHEFSELAKVLLAARGSMSYDIERGRPIEIDAFNGYVARRGREAGVDTPVNDAVISMIRRLHEGVLKPDPENLIALMAVVENRRP